MSSKSPNKSSPFIQLSLDLFSTESPFPIASRTGWRNALNGRSEETGSGLGASLDRFIDSRGVTFICIGTGSGFRRYISSDGYPWTLRLKHLRLERGTIVSRNSPAEIFHNGAKRQPYCRMNFRSHHHLVHRIVAQFFLNGGKPIPQGMQVDHLDGNRHNNAVSNLEIVTREENQRRCNLKHGWKHLSAHQRKLASETRKRRFARFHAAQQSAAQQNPTA